jgi:hypothetical protein
MTTYHANPYHGNINPSETTGLKLFQSATKPRDEADKLSCKISTSQEFIDAMKEDSRNFGWGLLIDTVTDGVDLLSITSDFEVLNLEMVRNHMSDTFYDDGGALIPEGYTDMNAFAIDPAADPTDRPVFFNRVRANMIGQRILGSLNKHAIATLKTKRRLYEWTQPDGVCYLDGPVMLQILIEKCKPSTRVGVSTLKTKIRAAKLANFGYNVGDMLDAMDTLRQQIEELGGSHDDIIMDMFNALETSNNDAFATHVQNLKTEWEEGRDFTVDELTTSATTKYNNLYEAKKWKTNNSSNDKIVALTTKVEELQKKLDTKSSNSGKGGGKGGSSDGNKPPPKLPDDESWRLKKSFGDKVFKMDKQWYWCCKQHNHGSGMYVTHKPEDHTPWQDRHHRGKKDKSKDSSSNKSDQSSSGNTSQKKSLTLNDKMKAAMVAKFKCSSDEATEFLKSIDNDSGN